MAGRRKKIIIINCSLREDDKASPKPPFPTTAVILLTTVLKQDGWDVHMLDGCLFDMAGTKKELARLADDDLLYVGLSVMTTQVPWAYDISEYMKSLRSDVPVVWGGYHATLFPEQTVEDPNVDIVAINESIKETILPMTRALHEGSSLEDVPGLCYIENGTVKKTRPSELDDIKEMPFVDFSLMDYRKYSDDNFLWKYYPQYMPKVKDRTFVIVTGLGCAYACNFCTNVLLGRRYRKRPAEEIVDRIEFLQKEYGANFFQFLDEDFMTSKPRIMKFLDLLEERKLKIYYRVWLRVDYFRDNYIDLETAKRLYKNGMVIAVMGAESGSQQVLNDIKKGITVEQIMRAAETLKQTGAIARFSFMVGMPGETREDILKTKALTEKLRSMNPRADVCVVNFRAYPGSHMYDDMKKNNYINEPQSLKEWRGINSKGGFGYFSIDESPWIKEPELVTQLVDTNPDPPMTKLQKLAREALCGVKDKLKIAH